METLCKTVLTEGGLNNTYVHCVQPIKGRYVKLKRLTYWTVYQRQWMNFCEVQVYGYLYHGKSFLCTRTTTRIRSYTSRVCFNASTYLSEYWGHQPLYWVRERDLMLKSTSSFLFIPYKHFTHQKSTIYLKYVLCLYDMVTGCQS